MRCQISVGHRSRKPAKELRRGVTVIDVSMPNLNGIDEAKQIRATCPTTTVLMVSAFDYQLYILASLQAGAAGYYLKDTPFRELVGAIARCTTGALCLTSKLLTRRHLATGGGSNKTSFEHLRAREVEVLKLTAKGMSNRQITGELSSSERAV